MNNELLQQARDLLSKACCTVSFSGAGLSAESGVSTFRDPNTGAMWERYDPAHLASPQGFAEDPALVMQWYAMRRAQIGAATSNPGHAALAAQSDMVHITQNVDDLFHRAGGQQIVQLHGTIAIDRCHARCGYEEAIDLNSPPPLRPCPVCGDQLRPGVVWFGESLPQEAWQRAEQACSSCDVLLVVGTSAVVYPAAGLISLAKSCGASVIM